MHFYSLDLVHTQLPPTDAWCTAISCLTYEPQ